MKSLVQHVWFVAAAIYPTSQTGSCLGGKGKYKIPGHCWVLSFGSCDPFFDLGHRYKLPLYLVCMQLPSLCTKIQLDVLFIWIGGLLLLLLAAGNSFFTLPWVKLPWGSMLEVIKAGNLFCLRPYGVSPSNCGSQTTGLNQWFTVMIKKWGDHNLSFA